MLDTKRTLRRAFWGAILLAPAAAVSSSACSSSHGSPPGTGGSGGSSSSSTSTSSPTPSSSSSTTASSSASSSSSSGSVPRVPITVTGATDTRFVTADHMFATVEMQLAGEPLAESMGRLLAGYSRDFSTPDVYFTPPGTAFPDSTMLCELDGGLYNAAYGACPSMGPDLVGFGTAVESYEYSKQPMNNLAFESGAGTSFLFAPLVNPTAQTGAQALAILVPRVQHFADASNASANFVHKVDGTDPTNRLGWPGFWPTTHPFRSFDPTIKPAGTVAETCSISSDDDPNATGSILNLDYECDYNSLHLPNRDTQVDKTITPGASGWADWKYALWVLNYLQSMHDASQSPIATVPAGQLGMVGAPGNSVVGTPTNAGATAVAGTFLGSSHIEGFQAQVMIDEIDNAAQEWLTKLTTTDGATLSGFASVEDALEYNYVTPLRWIPGAIGVTEASDPSGYPQPTGYAISDSGSHLFDLLGLAGAYATIYSLTDQANTAVGGSQPAMVYFDGDPFPADDQKADGESTLHDRALAIMRVALVNIDRIHRDPTSGLLVDDVTFSGATPTPGTTIDTTSVAYSIVGLRTVRRALGSQLQLYSNTTPDTATAGTQTILDDPSLPLTGAPGGKPNARVSDRLGALIDAESQLLRDKLTTADGHAYAGWDVAKGMPTTMDDTLDAHTAAIRGLLAAYLASGDTTYRDRAKAVFTRMDQVFYDPAGLIYVATPGAQTVSYTPKRFAVLEAALRDMYQLVGAQPGQAKLGKLLQNRIARLIKLVLNGWDDLNGNQVVDYQTECVTYGPVPGFGMGVVPIGRGGLQMAERALSGELGSVCDSIDPAVCADAGFGSMRTYTPDREKDCVPEISAAQLPSALANQITFKIGK